MLNYEHLWYPKKKLPKIITSLARVSLYFLEEKTLHGYNINLKKYNTVSKSVTQY